MADGEYGFDVYAVPLVFVGYLRPENKDWAVYFDGVEEMGDFVRSQSSPPLTKWVVFSRRLDRCLLDGEVNTAKVYSLVRKASMFYAIHNRLNESKELTDWLGIQSRIDFEEEALKPEKPK